MHLKDIPVLPIPRLVFYPNTSIPLMIIEPQYRTMIQGVLDHGLPLVLTLAEPRFVEGRLRYLPRLIGTLGRPVLLEELPDGTMKLVVHGMMRVKLLHVVQNIPHLIFNIHPIEDEFETQKLDPSVTLRLRQLLNQWLLHHVPDSLERETFASSIKDIASIVDHLCFFMVKDASTRQALLETTSLFERIMLLDRLFPQNLDGQENALMSEAIKDFEQLEERILVNH
jgi:Lon protease-like protein